MTERKRVLIVEDDEDVRASLERRLVRENCEVFQARDGQDGIERLEKLSLDLVITDLQMPRADGKAVLSAGLRAGVPVVVLTGHATVETAVELMRTGAANFLMKPFSPEQIRAALADAFGRKPRAIETDPAPRPARREVSQVTGEDPRFLEALETIDMVASTDATVLLLGESGSGKEVAARLIHQSSPRAKASFIPVNCGAIPNELIESELFGHVKGAFTGATQNRAGCFQQADGGTIFLDEVGDLPLQQQVKLLRTLQERSVTQVGDSQARPVDVRVIAATHQNLKEMVKEKRFRQDLYFRLNVVPIELPPLRDRRGDIPMLVNHFLGAANERHSRKVTGVSREVLDAFLAYSWPGNIRELAHAVERMVLLHRGTGELTLAEVPAELRDAPEASPSGALQTLSPDGVDLRTLLADLEESLIQQALERTRGNRNAAAALLRINRTTLVEKLKRSRGHGVTEPEPGGDDESG